MVQRNKRRLSGKVKGDIGTMNCPLCDWRIHSPFGRDYLVEHLMIHVENHHPEMTEKIRENFTKSAHAHHINQ